METLYYISQLKALKIKLAMQGFSDSVSFNAALVILQELNKDRRAEEMKAERSKDKNAPATQKQIAYIKDLGKDIDQPITKQEAAVLIEELLTNKANGKQ
jgi:hypothetical protein